jgi:hypothetical protein
MSSQETSQEEVVKAIYTFAAEQMKNGVSAERIQSILEEKGLDRKVAAAVVGNLRRTRYNLNQKAGRRNMIVGGLWCVGGILVTAITYSAASGGGTYIITWGAIIFGAIQFFRGLSQMSSG